MQGTCEKDMKVVEIDLEVHKWLLSTFKMRTKLEEQKRDTKIKSAISAHKIKRLGKRKTKMIGKHNKLIKKLEIEKTTTI